MSWWCEGLVPSDSRTTRPDLRLTPRDLHKHALTQLHTNTLNWCIWVSFEGVKRLWAELKIRDKRMNENGHVLQEQICWRNTLVKSFLSQLSSLKPASKSTDQPVFFLFKVTFRPQSVCRLCIDHLSDQLWYICILKNFFVLFFVPVTLRDGGVWTLRHAFMSWPEGKRNVTSAKSNYSGSHWPVWSCASYNKWQRISCQSLPDYRTAAQAPPNCLLLSILASSDALGDLSSELWRAFSAQCPFLVVNEPLIAPRPSRLLPPPP